MSTIKGLDSLIRKLNKLGGDVPGALEQAVKQTAELAADDARGMAPANAHSQAGGSGGGSLRQSITTEDKQTDTGAEARVFSNAPHSSYVEFGTGPVGAANHAGISPHVSPSYTSRKSWVYPVYDGGKTAMKVVKGKVRKAFGLKSKGISFVRTSGQPARPYLYPAAVKNKDTFQTKTRLSILEAIRKAGG